MRTLPCDLSSHSVSPLTESDTWKDRENLKNAKEAIKKFEKEYQRDMKDVARQECKETTFKRGELPEKFMAKMLYGWSDKWYDQEYWGRLERNWRRWKGKRPEAMKMIPEKEEVEEEKSGVREWTEEDEDEMGDMVDPYYEL